MTTRIGGSTTESKGQEQQNRGHHIPQHKHADSLSYII